MYLPNKLLTDKVKGSIQHQTRPNRTTRNSNICISSSIKALANAKRPKPNRTIARNLKQPPVNNIQRRRVLA